jgi:hypothetical protein
MKGVTIHPNIMPDSSITAPDEYMTVIARQFAHALAELTGHRELGVTH